MKVWRPCTHRVSPSARAESQIRVRAKRPRSHRIRCEAHTRCRLPQPWPCRGSLRAVCRHTPGDVIILPPAATCYTMEVSTIPGESHPGLGSAGSINAVPSAGRARYSLGLVIPAHKPHEPPWLPRYAKSQTCIPWRIRPPGDACGLARRDTLTEPARSSSPSANCRRSCALGSPGRSRPRKALPYEGGRSKGRPAAQQTLPDAARKPPSSLSSHSSPEPYSRPAGRHDEGTGGCRRHA